MRIKISALLLSLTLLGFASQAQAQCSLADQIAPNPNPVGSTINSTSATACSSALPFTNSGIFNNSGTLVINPATIFDNYGTLSNLGVFAFDNATLNNYNGATINNPGSLRNWVGTPPDATGGTLNNFVGGKLHNSGHIEVERIGAVNNYGTLNNSGVVSATHQATLSNYGTLINEPGASLSVWVGLSNHGTLLNYGHLNAIGFDNNGTLINKNSGGIASGRFGNNGTVINEGSLGLFEMNGSGTYIQTTGTTTLLTDISQTTVIINGGLLRSSASINGNLYFDGGTLVTKLIGTGAGQFDLWDITGSTTFESGALKFEFGFLPALGDEWTFLTAGGGVTGLENMSTLFEGVPSDYQFSLAALGGSATLMVAAVPEPEIYAMMGVGLALLGWVGRRKKLRDSIAA